MLPVSWLENREIVLDYPGGPGSSLCTCRCMCVLSCFRCVWLCVTLWTVAHQALLSMGFSRQEFWGGFFSRGSSRPMDQTWVSCIVSQILYCLSHWGAPPPPPNPCNAITKSFKWRQESQCQRERNKPAFPGFEAERGHEPRDFGRLQVLSWILSSINGFSPRASGISLPRLESWLYLWAVWPGFVS